MNDSTMKHISEFFSPKRMEEFIAMPEEEAKRAATEQGEKHGKTIIERIDIKERGVHGIAKVLKTMVGDEPTAKFEIEGNKLHMKNEGFCPVMAICLDYNLPWEKMCRRMGWPFFAGLAHAVNPKAEFSVLKSRHRGDPYCHHLFEIKENDKR